MSYLLEITVGGRTPEVDDILRCKLLNEVSTFGDFIRDVSGQPSVSYDPKKLIASAEISGGYDEICILLQKIYGGISASGYSEPFFVLAGYTTNSSFGAVVVASGSEDSVNLPVDELLEAFEQSIFLELVAEGEDEEEARETAEVDAADNLVDLRNYVQTAFAHQKVNREQQTAVDIAKLAIALEAESNLQPSERTESVNAVRILAKAVLDWL